MSEQGNESEMEVGAVPIRTKRLTIESGSNLEKIQTRRLSAGPATVSKSPAGVDRRLASTRTLGRSSLDNQTTSTCPDRVVVARKNASARSSLTGAALAGSATSQDATPSRSASATSCASSSSSAAHSPITWKLGTKLEAKDFMLKWYPAKVMDVDLKDNTVLIHFDGWNQRFDEWLPMDSPRLRPSSRVTECKVKWLHKVGEHVLARWTDSNMYPGQITAINILKGTYDIRFYDGLKKVVRPENVQFMSAKIRNEYVAAGLFVDRTKKRKLHDDELRINEEQEHVADTSASPDGESQGAVVDNKMIEPESVDDKHNDKHDVDDVKDSSCVNDDGAGDSDGTIDEGGDPDDTTDVDEPQKPQQTEGDVGGGSGDCNVEGGQKEVMTNEGGQPTSVGGETKEDGPTRKVLAAAVPQTSECVVSLTCCVEADVLSKEVLNKEAMPVRSKSVGRPPGRRNTGDKAVRHSVDSLTLMPKSSRPNVHPEVLIEPSTLRLKCPFSICDKMFRNATLVDYHVKYYHPTKQPVKLRVPGGVLQSPGSVDKIKRRQTVSICSTVPEKLVGGSGGFCGRRRWSTVGRRSEGASAVDTPAPALDSHDEGQQPADVDECLLGEASSNFVSVADDSTRVFPLMVSKEKRRLDAKARRLSRRLVNCRCRFNKDYQPCIQCTVCLCWQHVLCVKRSRSPCVGKKYVCFVCSNPPGIREMARYAHDQDWLNDGHMAEFSFAPPETNCSGMARIMKVTHDLVADLHGVRRVMSGVDRNIVILREKVNSEASIIMSPSQDSVLPLDLMSPSETPAQVASSTAVIHQASSPQVHQPASVQLNTSGTAYLGTQESCAPYLDTHESSAPSSHTTQTSSHPQKPQTCASQACDPTPWGHLPVSGEMVQGLAGGASATPRTGGLKCMDQDPKSSAKTAPTRQEGGLQYNDDEEVSIREKGTPTAAVSLGTANDNVGQLQSDDVGSPPPPMAPVQVTDQLSSGDGTYPSLAPVQDVGPGSSGEGTVDMEVCLSAVEQTYEQSMLSSITRLQDSVDERLNLIEEQVAALENGEGGVGNDCEDILQDVPRVKKTLHQLLLDLATVKQMSLYY